MSDRFVVQQGWLPTRELTVHCLTCSVLMCDISVVQSLHLIGHFELLNICVASIL